MGCANCNTCDVSEKRGCGTSSVFDWLYQVTPIKNKDKELIEVQFKADRKGYYANSESLNIKKGDWVAVEGDSSGHDIGKVTLKGDLVALQLKLKKIQKPKDGFKKIYRIASEADISKWKETINKEPEALKITKSIIKKSKHRVIIINRKRIMFMVMALGAAKG